MQQPPRKLTRQENLLRSFWVLLTFVMLALAVTLFESREDSRALALSKKSNAVLMETIAEFPDARSAMEAMMACIGKGWLTVDQRMDEDDFNRPRQVCPKYAAAVEALHPSPMGMHHLSVAYTRLVTGLKANL